MSDCCVRDDTAHSAYGGRLFGRYLYSRAYNWTCTPTPPGFLPGCEPDPPPPGWTPWIPPPTPWRGNVT